MSRLYEYCKMRWMSAAWDEAKLSEAVAKGYITEAEKAEIMTFPQTGYVNSDI